jgi:hypothetical protein
MYAADESMALRRRGGQLVDGQFTHEGWFQGAAIGVDEWHCPDISVTIALEKGGNTADQELE